MTSSSSAFTTLSRGTTRRPVSSSVTIRARTNWPDLSPEFSGSANRTRTEPALLVHQRAYERHAPCGRWLFGIVYEDFRGLPFHQLPSFFGRDIDGDDETLQINDLGDHGVEINGLSRLNVDARQDPVERRGEPHLGDSSLRRGEFGAGSSKALVCLLLQLHRDSPGADELAEAIGDLFGKQDRMAGLFNRGLRHPVIKFNHHVPRLDVLAFDAVNGDHNTRNRSGQFRAAAGAPGFRRFRLRHAVGFNRYPEVCLRHFPNLDGDLGLCRLPILGHGTATAGKDGHAY